MSLASILGTSIADLIGSFIVRTPWQPPCDAPEGYGCIPTDWLG